MKTRLLGALFACLVTLSFNASAIIVDYGDFSYDPATGWDWLDLHLTAGLAYDEVVAEMGAGGAYEGWRYATRAELAGFWNAFGGDDTYYSKHPDGTGNTYGLWSTQNNGLFDNMVSISGDLACQQPGDPYACGSTPGEGFSHWITADIANFEDAAGNSHLIEGQHIYSVISDFYQRPQDTNLLDYVSLTQFTWWDDPDHNNTGFVDWESGSALLRPSIITSPIPVPAPVWLLGSGLLGLVGMARRKKTA